MGHKVLINRTQDPKPSEEERKDKKEKGKKKRKKEDKKEKSKENGIVLAIYLIIISPSVYYMLPFVSLH